ncbi:MAG: 4Fe-4S binding protein [Planctomycetaceae bacterium]|nr:4Fe-4S binding protein [Planctomycetaceae bacterium]
MPLRKIVHIDEEKCDGCGQCVPSCQEGAIQIIGGKARLVSDVYCDGLGACLGHCPQGAIRIIERDAGQFDEAAVEAHLAADKLPAACERPHGGCPGAAVQSFGLNVLPAAPPLPGSPSVGEKGHHESPSSQLSHWPVQLALIPPAAPFLQGADLLLAAQCAAFAMGDFHEKLLQNRPIAIACPKLDNGQAHLEKLTAVLRTSDVRSLSIIRMEVPCCSGLVRIARAAIEACGKPIPLHEVVVSTRGEVK